MDANEGRDYRSVGEILRQAREQRRWSLQQASARTRIPVRLVEAVEADDLEALSGPIYARGFVRSLGECYELDVDFLLTKLSAAGVANDPTQLKAPVPPVTPVSSATPAGGVTGSVPSSDVDTTPVWTVESARVRKVAAPTGRGLGRLVLPLLGALAALTLGGLAWMQWGGGEGGSRALDAAPAAPRSIAESTRTEAGSKAVVGEATVQDEELPSESGIGETAPPSTPTENAAGPEPAAAAEVKPAAVADGVEVFDREALPAALESVEPEEAAEAPELRLTLMASGPLEVRWSADSRGDQPLVLHAGESRELRAQDHFSLAVDDPTVLRVLLNGRPYALPRPWDGSEILIPVAPAGGR